MKKFEINPRLMRSELMKRCKLHKCEGACCIYGVWADINEVDRIISFADLIISEMPSGWKNPQDWFVGSEEKDEQSDSGKVIHSRIVDQPRHYGGKACVFLRNDHKCALQSAALRAGMHAWEFKPFYCVLHPLDLDEQGRITLEETSLLLDEPGSCLRSANVQIPLLDTFEPELRYFLGDKEFERLRLLVP
jgi:Fe-S-cluster containining protein